MVSQHTCRIFNRIVTSLDKFLLGNITFESLFNGLEGNMSTLEEKLPVSFYDEWDKYWESFEMGSADQITSIDYYRDVIDGMKNLLISICPMPNDSDL